MNKPARGAEIERSHDVITHQRLRVGMSWLAQNFDFTRGDTTVKSGHRICLDITCMDSPTGTGAMTGVEYIPYHIGISKAVTHKVYRDAEHPSHLLLPIILKRSEESVER